MSNPFSEILLQVLPKVHLEVLPEALLEVLPEVVQEVLPEVLPKVLIRGTKGGSFDTIKQVLS